MMKMSVLHIVSEGQSILPLMANLHYNELKGKFSSEPEDLRIMLV